MHGRRARKTLVENSLIQQIFFFSFTYSVLPFCLSGRITSHTHSCRKSFMIVYHPSRSPGGSDEIMYGSGQRGAVHHAADSFVLLLLLFFFCCCWLLSLESQTGWIGGRTHAFVFSIRAPLTLPCLSLSSPLTKMTNTFLWCLECGSTSRAASRRESLAPVTISRVKRGFLPLANSVSPADSSGKVCG